MSSTCGIDWDAIGEWGRISVHVFDTVDFDVEYVVARM